MRIAAAWSWRILVVVGVIAVLIFLVAQLRYVVIPFLIGVLLAALLVPFSNWLHGKGWPKGLAVALNEVALIAVVAALITVVVFQVRAGWSGLQDAATARWEEFTAWLTTLPFEVSADAVDEWAASLWGTIQTDTSGILSTVLGVGSDVGHVLTGLLLALFTTLFILIDGRGIWNWLVRLFPNDARAAIVGSGQAGWLTLTTFVRVQISVAAIDAVFIGLGAWILGIVDGRGFPLVIPIAIAVFLASFVPIVGAIVSGAMAVLVALVFLGPIQAIVMLAIVLAVQQIEGHVLQPLLVGAVVKVHPLAVVLAVATGGFVAGIPGTLFAVPLVAVLNVVVGYIARGEWRTNPHPSVADVTTPLRRRTRAS